MPSKKRVEPLDSFETDVPITPEDVAAQWQIRDEATLTPKQYLDWCSWITRDSVAPSGDFPKEPFELRARAGRTVPRGGVRARPL